jgi:hypothetical protein
MNNNNNTTQGRVTWVLEWTTTMQSEKWKITIQGEQQQCKTINNNIRQGMSNNNVKWTITTQGEQQVVATNTNNEQWQW